MNDLPVLYAKCSGIVRGQTLQVATTKRMAETYHSMSKNGFSTEVNAFLDDMGNALQL